MATVDQNQPAQPAPAPIPVTPPVRLPSSTSASPDAIANKSQGYATDNGSNTAPPPAPPSQFVAPIDIPRMGRMDLGNISTPPPAPVAPTPPPSPAASPMQARYPVVQPPDGQGPPAPQQPTNNGTQPVTSDPFMAAQPPSVQPTQPLNSQPQSAPAPVPVDTGIQYNQLNSTAAAPFERDIQNQNQRQQLTIENQRARAQMQFEQAREGNYDSQAQDRIAKEQTAQQKQQDYDSRQQQLGAVKDNNAAADEDTANTGRLYQRDPVTGMKQPVMEQGRPVFKPSTSPVQTDAASGVPFVEQRDKYGNVSRVNPGNKDLTDTNVWTQDQGGNWQAVPAQEALSSASTPLPAKMQAGKVLWQQEQQQLKDQVAQTQEQIKESPAPLSPKARASLQEVASSKPITPPGNTPGTFWGSTAPNPDDVKSAETAETNRAQKAADAQKQLDADDDRQKAKKALADTNFKQKKYANDGPGGFVTRFRQNQTDLAGSPPGQDGALPPGQAAPGTTSAPVAPTPSNPFGNPNVPASPDLTPNQALAAVGAKEQEFQKAQDAWKSDAVQQQNVDAATKAGLDRQKAAFDQKYGGGFNGDNAQQYQADAAALQKQSDDAQQASQAKWDAINQRKAGLQQQAQDLQDFQTTTQKRVAQPSAPEQPAPAAGAPQGYQWNTDGNLINGQTVGKDNVVGMWKNGALEVPSQKDMAAALAMAGEKPVYLTPQDKPENIDPYGGFAARGGPAGGFNAPAQKQWAQNVDLDRKVFGEQTEKDTAAIDKQKSGIEADVSAKMDGIRQQVFDQQMSPADGDKAEAAVLDAVKQAHAANDALTNQKLAQAMDNFSTGKINSKQLNDLYAAAGVAKPGTDVYQEVSPQMKQNALADAQKQYQNGTMSPEDLAGTYKQLGIDMPKGDWMSYFHNIALQAASGLAKGVGETAHAVVRATDYAAQHGAVQLKPVDQVWKMIGLDQGTQKLIDNADALGSKGLTTAMGTSQGGDPRYINDFVTNSLKGASEFLPSMVTGEAAVAIGALQGGESYAQEAKKAGLSEDAQNANFALGALTMGGMQKILGPVKWLHEASDPSALLSVLSKQSAGATALDLVKSAITNVGRTAAEGGVLSATGQAGLYYAGAKDKDGNPTTNPLSMEGLEGDLQGAAGMTVFAPLGVLARGRGLREYAKSIDDQVQDINAHNSASGEPLVTAKDVMTSQLNVYKGQQTAAALTDIQSKFHAIDQTEGLNGTQILAKKNKLLSAIPDEIRPNVIAHLDAIGQAHDNIGDLWQAAEQEAKKAPTPEAKQAIYDQASKGSDDITAGLHEAMALIEKLAMTKEGKGVIDRNNAWNSRPGTDQPMDIRNTFSNSNNAADIMDEVAKNRRPFDAAAYSMAKKANNDAAVNFDPKETATEMTRSAQATDPTSDPISADDVSKATDLMGKPLQTPRSMAIKEEQGHWESMLQKASDRGDVQGVAAIHDHLIHLEQQHPAAHAADLADGIAANKDIGQAPPHMAPSARGLVKIGTGKPLHTLTSSELQGAGISADGKGGYKANVTADDLGDPTDPRNKKPVHMGPVQFDQYGQPHVTDEAKANLATTMPNAAKLIPDEMDSRINGHFKVLKAEADAKEAAAQAAKLKPEIKKEPEAKETKAEKPEWVGHGEDDTEVRIGEKEAKDETEAREKLAGKLPPGEKLKDVQPPVKEAKKQTRKVTLSPGDDLRARMKGRIAAEPNEKKRALIQHTVDILAPQLDKYSDLFPGGIDFEPQGAGGGLTYEPNSKQLRVDIGRSASTIYAEESNGGNAERVIGAMMQEELIHRAATDVLSRPEVESLWNKLPWQLQKTVRETYHAAKVQSGEPLPTDNPYQLGHEFVRMLTQDKLFGQITEGTFASKNLIDTLKDLLGRIAEHLKDLLNNGSIVHPETKKLVNDTVSKIESRLKDLGVMSERMDIEPPAPNRVEQTTPEAARPPPTPFQFEPEKVEEKKSAIEAQQEKKPELPKQDADAYGNSDTAYTDKNEPIKYQWAVSSAKKLIVSNHDNGAVNPDFPQTLQPRDRTSAASQMQVNDIKNNMNFVRLSGGDNVSGGSPMTGDDGVVESGNGRVMGMRRGYAEGTDSSKAYKHDLMENATKYGLDRDKIAAIPDPILHRVRLTDVDRRKFAEVANGANIMPMREVETARKDAHNLTPAVLDLFHPDESGDMFAASNLPFLMAFNKHVVPEGERAAVVDKDGMISQTGARRIRNALFAYAYGSTSKGMSALGRMTESVDPEGKNLTNALLAAAPGFAKNAGKIKSGALHPIGISDDVLAAATKLMELKAKGEKVSDFMAQREMFGDQMTPFQKGLLQFFDKNGRSTKKLGQALNRYNYLLDQAGHPGQQDMLGGAAPTKEGLWNLAKKPAPAPEEIKLLSSPSHVAEPPPLAANPLKVYNRLTKLKTDGAKLNPDQERLLETAEKQLGQKMIFDEAQDFKATKAKIDGAWLATNIGKASVGAHELTTQNDMFAPKEAQGSLFAAEHPAHAAAHEIRDMAEQHADQYLDDVKDAGKAFGLTMPEGVRKNAVKSKESLVDKLELKPGKVPSDLLRTTLVSTKSRNAIHLQTLQFIKAMADKGYKIYAPGGKPDIDSKHTDRRGYKDVALKFVKDGDPIVREMQILQPAMLEAKNGPGHVIYDQDKKINITLGETSDPHTTAILRERLAKNEAESHALYDAAYAKDNPDESQSSDSETPGRTNIMSASDVGLNFPSAETFAKRASAFASADTRSATDMGLAATGRSFIQKDNTGEVSHGQPETRLGATKHAADDGQMDMFDTLTPDQVAQVHAQEEGLIPDKDAPKTPDEAGEAIAKAHADYRRRMDHADSQLKSGTIFSDEHGKLSKGAGMQRAADLRKAMNTPTWREKNARDLKQASNFKGKEVSVDGKNAVVQGQVFGKTKVQFEDGTTKNVEADDIEPRETLSSPESANAQTETPEFKKWFGDSQVMDDQGKPLVVYHGSREDIDTFDKGRSKDGGFHFGTEVQAKMRNSKNLIPVYLRAENLRRSKDEGGGWESKIRSAKAAGYDGIVYLNRFEGIPNEAYTTPIHDYDKMSDGDFRKKIPAANDSYIVFDPKQIKSAIGNRGTFDTKDANILHSPRHVGDLQKGQPSLQLGMYRNPGEFDLAEQLERDTKGDPRRSDLVKDNMGLATHIANRYKIPGVDMDDIVQEARIGLMKAAEGFDASKGANFGSYAGRIIHNRLNDVYKNGMNTAQHVENTLNELVGDTGKTREEMTPGVQPNALPIERNETSKITEEELSKLPDRPQTIVRAMMAGKNGEEIAQELGMTRQGVNQSMKGALMVMRKRLEARGLKGQEDGILHSSETPKDDDNDLQSLFADLSKDMPSDDEVDEMRDRASAEEMGQKTIGEPRKANPGKNENERREFDVAHQLAEDKRRKQEESDWVHEASAQLRDDEEGFKKTLLQKAINPEKYGNFTPAEVKGAQMLVPRLMREAFESGDDAKRKEAFKLAWAYDAGGTEQARALAARRDPFKTPAERSREFLTKLISTPSPDIRAQINHEVDPGKRQKLLADAQDERYGKIVKALGDMGITPEDIFKGDVNVNLKSSKLVVDAVKGLGDAMAQRLGRMILDKFTPGQMAKATGMSKDFVIERRDKFLANLDAQWDKWLDRGFSEDQIANELKNGDLSKLFSAESPDAVRKGTMTPEQKAAAKKRLTEMVVGNLKDVDAGKYQRRLKRRVDKPAPYDGRGPSDAPIPAYENMKQDVMRPDLGPEDLAAYNRARRPTADADAARYHQQQLAYEKEQPYEYVKYDPNSIDQTYKLARAIQGAAGNNKFDMVYEAWINSILSGPQTHVALSMGMGANAAWNFTMQRGMEAAMNAAFVHDPNSAQFGEFKHIARAVMPAISRALKFAAKVYKSEEHYAFEREALNTQMEFKGYDKTAGINATIPGTTGRVIRIPSRVVMAQDSFFKQIIGNLEASAQGYRIGKAQGLKGEDLENFIRSQVNLPGSMAWQRAVKMAEEGTFQTELRAWGKGGGPAEGFAKVLQDARHKDNPSSLGGQLGQKALGFVLPFVRTPYNIFRTGLSKTPLGAGAVGMRIADGLYKMKDGKPFFDTYSKAQFVKDLSTQTIAWATAALMYGAVEGDKDDDSKPFLITGSRPHGIAKQGEVDLANRTTGGAYQIRIGGRNGVSFNYGRIEPFATVISTMADAMRIAKQGQDAGASIAKFGKYFMAQAQDKTFLQGISSIAEAGENAASTDPGAATKAIERQILTGLVPNLIRQPLRNLDDFERDSRNAGALYGATALGGSANKKIDLYGEATQKAGNPISRIFARSGDIPTSTIKMGDQFLQNWNRLNPDKPFYPSAPSNAEHTYKNAEGAKVKMTPDEITEFDKQVGQRFAQGMDDWLTPEMADSPTDDDRKTFEEQHTKAMRDVRDEMFGGGAQPEVPHRGTDISSLMGWK